MANPSRVPALVFWGAIALATTAGCAKPDVEIRALPDGARELTCRHTLPQCLSHVEDVCKGASYEVLYATDTQKIYGSPSSSEVESRTSQAVVHCLGPHQKPMEEKAAGAALMAAAASAPPTGSTANGAAESGMTSGGATTGGATAGGATAGGVTAGGVTAAVAPARVCVPGATQACVGSGACSGGQACLPDGSGFAPCDCGTAKPAP